jgi:CheY-like chemotaxis protein
LPCDLKTVLIVDDRECIRTSMAIFFEEFGYSVRFAEDGHSALRQINEQSPDILLSDLQMPGMSGRELLINVRVLFPVIKVIATSGSFCGNEVPPGILADAFYPKGSSVSALLHILRELPHMSCRVPESLATGHHAEPRNTDSIASPIDT